MYQRLLNEDDQDDHHYSNYSNGIELKSRNKDRKFQDSGSEHEDSKFDFIYHTIKPEETLLGIALRYNCAVSKLRVHNRLMNDQEFYALRVIKIPILKFSVLNGVSQKDQSSSNTLFVSDLVEVNNSNTAATNTKVINIGISNYLNINGSDDYNKFLDNLSEDLKEIRKQNELKIENLPLPNDVHNMEAIKKPSSNSNAFLSCDGSDYGIRWRYLIIVLITICLLVPSFVLYNLEHHNSTSSHHYHQNNSIAPDDHSDNSSVQSLISM